MKALAESYETWGGLSPSPYIHNIVCIYIYVYVYVYSIYFNQLSMSGGSAQPKPPVSMCKADNSRDPLDHMPFGRMKEGSK